MESALKPNTQEPVLPLLLQIQIKFENNNMLSSYFKNIFGSFFYNTYCYFYLDLPFFKKQAERIEEFFTKETDQFTLLYFDLLLRFREALYSLEVQGLQLEQLVQKFHEVINICACEELILFFFFFSNHFLFTRRQSQLMLKQTNRFILEKYEVGIQQLGNPSLG